MFFTVLTLLSIFNSIGEYFYMILRVWNKRKFYLETVLGLLVFLGAISTVLGDETKWIAIGSLHNWYSSAGSEVEVGRTGAISDQGDGLRWPAQFRFQDNQAAKGFWIGTKDFDDTIAGQLFAYKVVHVGPRGPINEKSEFMPVEFSLHAKFNHPIVLVDGEPATDMENLDLIDVVNKDLPTDRMLYTEVNTAIGITMIRKIYVNSQQFNDNYHIVEYIFKNTGIINLEGDVQQRTLTGVMFYWQYRYAISREGGVYGVQPSWLPQNTTWGRNTVNETIGEIPSDNDPFRAIYSWHGKHSDWSGPGDNIGAPAYLTDGHLSAQQYVGVAVIHADVSPSDNSDDPIQPVTTIFLDSDGPVTSALSQFNEAKMTTEYLDFMIGGHPDLSHAESIGDGNANEFGPTAGGYSSSQGFGPYTLEFGDSIRIVLVEAAAGVSRSKGKEIGANWLKWANGNTGPFEMPDGSTTSDGNEYKNAWVFTGEDSLLQTFKRATESFNTDFDIPQPPPPPETFRVSAGGDRIQLEWETNAESWPGFAGYRLYRAIHKPDTTFDLIFETGAGTDNPLANSFSDKEAIRGFDYYYYVQSFDDGSAAGVSLTSSLFYTVTNKSASLKRPPLDANAKPDMNDIRIVPNPYNIKAQNLQFGESGKNKLFFYNIPSVCTIKIYTERGDLVETIFHTDGSGDQAWESATSSRQLVVSGLYIAHIEVPIEILDSDTKEVLFRKGESVIKKFVIIR